MQSMNELVNKSIDELAEPKIERKEMPCETCGKTFSALKFWKNFQTVCPDCFDSERKKEENEKANKVMWDRKQGWKSFCPPEYKAIDVNRLPNPEVFSQVMAWQYGSKGLLFHGDTGRGKTRCAWALLEREWMEGRYITVLDSMAGIKYAAKYHESPAAVEEWLNKLKNCELILLDDVFKVKMTDSFESAIFTLVDQRIAWQRPTIFTSNDTGATLASRMTADRGNPMLRRLREHCTIINF